MQPPTTPHPSQTVERIREIIVGRRLDHLEHRLVRLESGFPAQPDPAPHSGEARLNLLEAKIECLHQRLEELPGKMAEADAAAEMRRREDLQRLAAMIQQNAAAQPGQVSPQSAARLEQKLGGYLEAWQSSLQQYLQARDQYQQDHLERQLSVLREWVERQVAGVAGLAGHALSRDEWKVCCSRLAEATETLAAALRPSPPATPPSSDGPDAA